MSTMPPNKINRLLSSTVKGTVLLTSWLRANGYSADLIKKYRKSGWLESIGFGANIRAGDTVDYFGALYALQTQCSSSIHIGARSALSLLAKSHYLELSPQKVVLFAFSTKERPPAWFVKNDWKINFELHFSNFLAPNLGTIDLPIKDFKVRISGDIRALMECLYLVPDHQELTECYEFMEGMNNLHPKKVQELLDNCNSVKVKRLFLYLAEKAKHEWVNYLNLSTIDLGAGNRKIITDGFLDKKYKITLPKMWKP